MPSEQFSLAGRTALVTGSTGGLGFAIAAALAQCGCNIVLNGLEPPKKVAELSVELARHSAAETLYCRADLARETEVNRLIDAALARFGTVDVLVNNAVVRHFATIENLATSQWEHAMAVNVTAAFHTIRRVLPGMRQRKWGRIVNMSSIYGQRGAPGRSDYVTTKAALVGLTRAVATELATQNITCNAVCPGSVATPGTTVRVQALMHAEGISEDEAISRFLTGKQPSGRFVSAESVAAMVAFLCGPAGRDITGAVLPIDGGWLAS
jgi:3-hydroxybutyrate dehydrogenase